MYFQDFLNGQSFDAYEYFGAHIQPDGVMFRVYAPNSDYVALIGDFSSWEEIPMAKNFDGVHEVFVDYARAGMMYKYKIYKFGYYQEHSDPYGFSTELRPGSASVICDISYEFQDKEYMKNRSLSYNEPLNIYEMHFGAWKVKNNSHNDDRFYNYLEIGDILIDYLKEHSYNAVEFMPLTEHPADISWGYQSTGFFAPTSRYGTPVELKMLIDKLHSHNIKVIMDFVPVHFAIDGYSLGRFDGTALYEYDDDAMGVSEWGSYNFNHANNIAVSFLKSSANFWLSEYHFDGLRMDAVSRIIYYQGDSTRGINHSGLEFMKSLNYGIRHRHKSAILIAEDSSDFEKVTEEVENGGLGFTYKWDMGWMNDTIDFFKLSPAQRRAHYHDLSFSMMYYYSERLLLSFSHDENVHGKATIVQKMYGNYENKFPQARALYMYMFTHPGKKLNFMGAEMAHLREFDETRQLDFDILKYPIHSAFNRYIKDLNEIYITHPALYEEDYSPDGFKWLIVEDKQGVTYAYLRKNKSQILVCVFNFSDEYHTSYEYKTNNRVLLREILNTNWDIYGGTEKRSEKMIKSICVKREEILSAYVDEFDKEMEFDKLIPTSVVENVEYLHYVKMDLPPYTARLFELVNIEDYIK